MSQRGGESDLPALSEKKRQKVHWKVEEECRWNADKFEAVERSPFRIMVCTFPEHASVIIGGCQMAQIWAGVTLG